MDTMTPGVITITVYNVPTNPGIDSLHVSQYNPNTYVEYWAPDPSADKSHFWDQNYEDAQSGINMGVVEVHRGMANIVLNYPGQFRTGGYFVPSHFNYRICWGESCSEVKTIYLDSYENSS